MHPSQPMMDSERKHNACLKNPLRELKAIVKGCLPLIFIPAFIRAFTYSDDRANLDDLSGNSKGFKMD